MEIESDRMSTSDRSDLSVSEENITSADEEECPQHVSWNVSLKKKAVRFSEAQRACLNAYYVKGMSGTGKNMHPLICKAAKDTHLSTAQVKVWTLL